MKKVSVLISGFVGNEGGEKCRLFYETPLDKNNKQIYTLITMKGAGIRAERGKLWHI